MKNATPKKEMVRRFSALASALQEQGDHEGHDLIAACETAIKRTVPADAPITEVVGRTLSIVIKKGAALRGKLTLSLSYLASTVGLDLSTMPALLLAVLILDPENQDWVEDGEALIALSQTLLDECLGLPYEELIVQAIWMAEIAELPCTLGELEDLQAELHEQGDNPQRQRETVSTQLSQLREQAQREPPKAPDYEWLWKTVLTLLTLIAAAGVVIEAMSDPIGTAQKLLKEAT